ncbi:MAG: hypothetical protein L0K65_00860 [Actinomyces sp.]|nr:hypothetical protein [Propionibacterium sp.]MDN6565591.1 hypothetical protein [Actinomyces sp.]
MSASSPSQWSCRYEVVSSDTVTPQGGILLEVAARIPECMTPGTTLEFTRIDGEGVRSTHLGRYVGALGVNYCYLVEDAAR